MNKLIVGSIVGNEKCRWLEEWLINVKEYADVHCVIDDGSTDGTKEVLENSGCMLLRNEKSLFKNNESKLRTQLWELIRRTADDGDWIIIVDADEFYPDLKRKKQELMKVDDNVIAIRLCDMWNEEEYRIDGFWSPYFHRMFRFVDWDFCITGDGLHLPSVPQWVLNSRNVYMSNLRCLHYSYIRDEDKKQKYNFYLENVKDSFNLNHARSIMEVTPELVRLDQPLPKILITSLIHNRAWILKEFLKCLDNINYPKELIEFCFIVNNNKDDGVEILKKWNDKCLIMKYDFPNEKGEHEWDGNLIYHMAVMRNQTLNVAEKLNVDYMINIDSDILFPSNVIKHLVESDKKIISPVFFAGWNSDKKLPQCWDKGGYDLSENLLNCFKTKRGVIRVGGLGAFTCVHKTVWEKCVNYNRVYNLPDNMFGEDRDFCTRASVNGFMLFATTYFDLIHIDNKKMYDELKTTLNIFK